MSARFPGAPLATTLGEVAIVRSRLLGLHLAALRRVARLGSEDVVVGDLAHVIPWPNARITRPRHVAFFRHLHARTLGGQTTRASAAALAGVERMYPILYGNRVQFVTESHAGAADLQGLGIGLSQIYVIPPGVDSKTYRPMTRTGTARLVHFSGLRPYKRPAHAIALLRLLLRRGVDAELVIVGGGPHLSGLQEEASDLGERVRFPGHLPEAELVRVVAQSWLHVACSVSEGWGYSAWEAASCGVPTVAYRVPGLQESVLDGVTGALVRDEDLAGMSDAAISLLGVDEGWRGRCRRAVEGKTWEASAKAWRSMLGLQ